MVFFVFGFMCVVGLFKIMILFCLSKVWVKYINCCLLVFKFLFFLKSWWLSWLFRFLIKLVSFIFLIVFYSLLFVYFFKGFKFFFNDLLKRIGDWLRIEIYFCDFWSWIFVMYILLMNIFFLVLGMCRRVDIMDDFLLFVWFMIFNLFLGWILKVKFLSIIGLFG